MKTDDEAEYENAKMLPLLMSHYPSGTSSKNFEEVMQLEKYGFVHYSENSFSPIIEYDLRKIQASVKIAIQEGTGDKLLTTANSRMQE